MAEETSVASRRAEMARSGSMRKVSSELWELHAQRFAPPQLPTIETIIADPRFAGLVTIPGGAEFSAEGVASFVDTLVAVANERMAQFAAATNS